MTLFETMKSDLTACRKKRDQLGVKFLSTLVGELTANAKMVDGVKVVTDEAAVLMAKKYLKGVDEVLAVAPTNEQALYERPILELYLPTMLSEEELTKIIEEKIAEGDAHMGKIMSWLKLTYPNQYEGRVASNITKMLLS